MSNDMVNDAEVFDDDMDESLAGLADAVSTPSEKRKRNEDDGDMMRMKKHKFTSALRTQLSLIDPDESLAIHKFLDDHDKDPVVKEYVEKLLRVGSYPNKPDEDDIANFDKVNVKCELSANCHTEVVELLMAFFHCRYSNNNLTDAIANNCAVIPVQAKITIPYFAKTPAKLLHEATNFKTTLALHLQGVGVEATDFTSELLYISAAFTIHAEVSKSVTNKNELVQEVQTQFEIHFLKSEMEYARQANIKNIDFKTHRSKIKHIEPRWRALGLQPPISIYNRFATKIKSRILKKEERFDPSSIKTEFIGFMVEGEKLVEKMKLKALQRDAQAASSSSQSRHPSSSISVVQNRPSNNIPCQPAPVHMQNYRGRQTGRNYDQNLPPPHHYERRHQNGFHRNPQNFNFPRGGNGKWNQHNGEKDNFRSYNNLHHRERSSNVRQRNQYSNQPTNPRPSSFHPNSTEGFQFTAQNPPSSSASAAFTDFSSKLKRLK